MSDYKVLRAIEKRNATVSVKIAKFIKKFPTSFLDVLLDNGIMTISTFGGGKSSKVRLFGHTLFDKESVDLNNGKLVFYFKINRIADYTLQNIQYWIDVVSEYGADFYFVCDDPWLEYQILKKCTFKDGNIKFIRSWRKKLKRITPMFCTPGLEDMTCAHLTPFYHAKEKGYKKCWMIDADDTMFLLSPKRIVELLLAVERKAESEKIQAFSLDMWRSKTFGAHWSLGILLVTDASFFCNLFSQHKDELWHNETIRYQYLYNLDWFMTYSKNHNMARIETFYVDNCRFIHWGKLISDPIFSAIYHWCDGKLVSPIMKYLYGRRDKGEIPICKDCIKIDIGISAQESLSIMENELCRARFLGNPERTTHGMNDFAVDSHFYINVR